MQTIYLDSNATTNVAPEVMAAMLPFFTTRWGNPSSMHLFGGEVSDDVKAARQQVADFIHANPSEIIFTSCGTEGDNTAIFGAIEVLGPKTTIITSCVEHPAVLGPAQRLKTHGHTVIEIPVDRGGNLDMQAYRIALAMPGPKFVSIMWANNETGVTFPMKELATLAKAAGAIMHTDAVQVAGKLDIDMRDVPVDMLTISGHKLHAPKGIGMLYLRRGVRIKPFMIGGHQESGRRGGTENVPYIMGLAEACRLAKAALTDGSEERIALLRDKLESGLLAACPDSHVNGDTVNRMVNTTNISFRYIEGEAILYHMSDLGICASSGSACAAGSLEPSHVIRSMGTPFTLMHGSIRFSLSRYTTEAEIDYALQEIPKVIKRLRDLSPFVD